MDVCSDHAAHRVHVVPDHALQQRVYHKNEYGSRPVVKEESSSDRDGHWHQQLQLLQTENEALKGKVDTLNNVLQNYAGAGLGECVCKRTCVCMCLRVCTRVYALVCVCVCVCVICG